MPKLTDRTAISSNIDQNLLIHVVDTTSTATSYKATLSQLYGIFPKNSSAGAGDVNYVARWTAANELGKGVIRDNGTTVSIGGALESSTSFKVVSTNTRAISQTGFTSYNYMEGTLMLNWDNYIANASVYARIKESTGDSVGYWAVEDPFTTYNSLIGYNALFTISNNEPINNNAQIKGFASSISFGGDVSLGTNVDVYNYFSSNSATTIPSTKTVEEWGAFYANDSSFDNDLAITNYYGLYLGTITGSGIANNWGIYQNEPTQTNYLAGQLSINDTTPSSATKLTVVGGSSDNTVTKSEITTTGGAFFQHSAFLAHVNPSGSVGSNGVVGIHGRYGGSYNILLTDIRAAIWSTAVSTESLTSLFSMRADGVEAATGHTIDTAYASFVGANKTSGTGAITKGYGIYQGGSNLIDMNRFNAPLGLGKDPTASEFLAIDPATTSKTQINLETSGGTNPSSPNSGDLWWNGTNLYFNDGTTDNDLLSGGGGNIGETTVKIIPSNADINLFSDSNLDLFWDISGNDIELDVKTDPATSRVHAVFVKDGTTSAFDVLVSSGNVVLDTSFLNDDACEITINAPSDSAYPSYRFIIKRSNSTYYTNSPFMVIATKWTSYD